MSMQFGKLAGCAAVALSIAALAGSAGTAKAAEDLGAAQFLGIDRNGDEKIDVDEANAYRYRLFVTLDQDGDHRVTKDEWVKAAKLRANKVPAGGVEMPDEFREADTNDDNILTSVEFWALGPVRFVRMDANSDSVISKSEFKVGEL